VGYVSREVIEKALDKCLGTSVEAKNDLEAKV
jgi:hypothetical protein